MFTLPPRIGVVPLWSVSISRVVGVSFLATIAIEAYVGGGSSRYEVAQARLEKLDTVFAPVRLRSAQHMAWRRSPVWFIRCPRPCGVVLGSQTETSYVIDVGNAVTVKPGVGNFGSAVVAKVRACPRAMFSMFKLGIAT